MKKIYYFITILFASSTIQNTVGPEGLNKSDLKNLAQGASVGAKIKDTALENLRQKAIQQIQTRIDHLNNLITKINSDKKLTSEDKSSLIADINNEINRLSTLKNKISQDTDTGTIRSDFKQVLSEKIYLYYSQKIRLSITIDNLLSLEKRLEDLSSKLRTLITTLPNNKNVSQLQILLNDMNTRLSQIKLTLETDKSKLMSTTPSSYIEVFRQVRIDLSTVRQSFAKIREDLAKMRNTFTEIKNAAAGPTRSLSSTSSSSSSASQNARY